MKGCCDEHGCRRTKPILIVQGGFSGTWYAVTDYEHVDGGDTVLASQKHRLPDSVQGLLNATLAQELNTAKAQAARGEEPGDE